MSLVLFRFVCSLFRQLNDPKLWAQHDFTTHCCVSLFEFRGRSHYLNVLKASWPIVSANIVGAISRCCRCIMGLARPLVIPLCWWRGHGGPHYLCGLSSQPVFTSRLAKPLMHLQHRLIALTMFAETTGITSPSKMSALHYAEQEEQEERGRGEPEHPLGR
jgi:hypothetical protein